MVYHSILFKNADYLSQQEALLTTAPEFFADLNLDPVIETITHGREEYDLKPFFYTVLTDKNTILYRHEIMQDIEKPALLHAIHAFVFNIRLMRQSLTQSNRMYYPYQKERLFLEAVEIYCRCLTALSDHFSEIDLQSQGLLTFYDYLQQYLGSESFTGLSAKTKQLIENLSAIKYAVLIRGDCVSVCYPGPETDYSAEVEQTFQKFRQAAVKDYRIIYPENLDMNHIEAQILEKVAKLYPEIFGEVS
ncbi:MAG: DNA mismatch repair protein MutS, partial [Proteobacteria bacterium]|nr:DNA mismatch repair protein MutS [Pseudomonadota bacterium]